ncbi:MAG: aminoacyl-tRNA hydrolase [Planctomycetia bacterium]
MPAPDLPAQLLAFGLGNPGSRYADTRHNVGWRVLQALAGEAGAGWRRSGFYEGEEARIEVGGRRLHLVLPTTFMNLCGPAYVRALAVHEVEPAGALVVVDDFMLPFGRLRVRAEGSPGGHNGLKSIEQALGHARYARLRVGIGPVDPPQQDAADFVLGRWSAEQQAGLPRVVERAAAAVRTWAEQGLEAAANACNRGEAP